jgi:hypothetical protein
MKMGNTGRHRKHPYHGFSESVYMKEAGLIQARINTRLIAGRPITSDVVWSWIKTRHPGWHELDWEKVFKLVKLG